MQASRKRQSLAGVHGLCHHPKQEIEPFCLSPFQIIDSHNGGSHGTMVSFQTFKEPFFTLESSTVTGGGYIVYDSPSAVCVSSNRSPFSPHGSLSWLSDPHHSPDNTCGSPTSGSSVVDDGSQLKHKLRELEISLLGPESDIVDSGNFCFKSGVYNTNSSARWELKKMMQIVPKLDLKEVLIACAQAVSDFKISAAGGLMDVLERMVSVHGEPIQRLGAYMLEGLRAKLESSGSKIYKALRCEEPTSSELMSYMHILYQICPYWKFAYMSANVVIGEAMENESRIHIIDFQICQGSQWVPFIQALADRPGGPPFIRITGVDDSQSALARGGGLHIVGQRLAQVAKSCQVPFEFHDAAISGSEIQIENLWLHPGEALAVNFPYVLHHMPDESVSTCNHRDQLLRLVKSLSPKVVTLLEQESNTNTSPFFPRFLETLDYYTAMFESIDAACPRDDKQRISAEQHCVARDIVNMIACEGAERVERHELLGKWRSRFMMAGFTPCPMSSSATIAIRDLLKDYNKNYRIQERDGALYLGWRNRDMSTSSAWK